MKLFYYEIPSPVGTLFLMSDQEHLRALLFQKNTESFMKKFPQAEQKKTALLKDVESQLKEYFSGKRETFSIPYYLEGTEFQKKVWEALNSIPYGKTVSYQEQALRLKNPLAVRAVGRTNGLNPISIILPCHRVLGKNGKLTGYGGGLPIKEFLLKLEAQTYFKKLEASL